MRKSSRRIAPVVILLLLAMLVVRSLAIADVPRRESRAASFSGKEIFRGIFFASGPAAELFPEITESVERALGEGSLDRAEVVAGQRKLIALMEKDNPEFFAKFRSLLTSGDEYLVRKGLRSGTSKLLDAAAMRLGTDRQGLVAEARGMGSGAPGRGLWFVYSHEVAVFQVVALASAAVLTFFLIAVDVATPQDGGVALPMKGTSLEQDEAVRLVTSRLAAR